jgi:hypothetical protein
MHTSVTSIFVTPLPGILQLGSWIKRYIQADKNLWRRVVDAKYNTTNPNVLCFQDTHPSTFWKGVMLPLKLLSLGIVACRRWKIYSLFGGYLVWQYPF